MSKTNKAIAALSVVASLGVAAAPMSAFANTYYPNRHTDGLSVTIEEVCAFGYTYSNGTTVAGGAHQNGAVVGNASGTGAVQTSVSGSFTETSKTAGRSFGVWQVGSATQSVTTAGATVEGISNYDYQDTTPQNPVPSTTPTNTTEVVDVAYGIMENNTANLDFARTKLNVVCNDAQGYYITALSEDLSDVYNVGHDIPQTSSAPTAGTSNWSFKYGAVANSANQTAATETGVRTLTYGSTTDNTWDAATTTAKNIISMQKADGASGNATTPQMGDTYEITYGVGLSTNQEAGTYEGEITYTLIKGADS